MSRGLIRYFTDSEVSQTMTVRLSGKIMSLEVKALESDSFCGEAAII
jgi:hypothetical protein